MVNAARGDGSGAVVPAGAQPAIAALAADDDGVYWLSFSAGAKSSIARVDKEGSAAPSVVVDDANAAIDLLAVDDAYVYWTTDAAVVRAPKTGGAPVVVAATAGPVVDLAVDGTSVYWSDFVVDASRNAVAGSAKLKKAARDGGAPRTLVEDGATPLRIAVDAASVYWTSGVDDSANGQSFSLRKLTPK